MPDVRFFLFGMGNRTKFIYKNGRLKNAFSGDVVRQWNIQRETISPADYTVDLETKDEKIIRIAENEKGVYLLENGRITVLSENPLQLPTFEGHPFAPVLRVLHHEILMNIVDGKPVPNLFVYDKPWFRDAALMAMVLQQTGNLLLIKDWILNLRDPFDRNNRGINEPDNLGQVLYLVSLVADSTHPIVQMVLDSVNLFRKETYIEGKTDYTAHPVYQTKWLKYGLQALNLPDTLQIPLIADSYSSLFWLDYRDQHVATIRFNEQSNQNYPYFIWAEDRFYGEHRGAVTNREYPLSWEAQASEARYEGLQELDVTFARQKLAAPHSWHAAEMFLQLFDWKGK